MKLAVSIATPEVKDEPRLALFEGSFEERLAKAKAYGYDGIELVTKAPAALDMIHLECLLKRYRLQAAAVASGVLRLHVVLHYCPPRKKKGRLRSHYCWN